jgi:hypothetical protein
MRRTHIFSSSHHSLRTYLVELTPNLVDYEIAGPRRAMNDRDYSKIGSRIAHMADLELLHVTKSLSLHLRSDLRLQVLAL